MNEMPFASIIIPTHNRLDMLPITFAALTKQTYPADKMELIVVADGCQDETAFFVQEYIAPFPIALIEQTNKGPSSARNCGAKVAIGNVLIFIDDDVEVTPDFVKAHVEKHIYNEDAIVLGALPIVGESNGSFFNKNLRQWWTDKFRQLNRPDHRFQYGDLYTGNVSVDANLFNRLGGFNTALWCHEDYEFGLRAAQHGANFYFSYDALAYHHDNTELKRSLKRRQAEGQADIYLARTYPKLRYQLPLSAPSFSFLSRLLRFLAFNKQSFGNLIVRFILFTFPLLEAGKIKRLWQMLFYHLQDYFYWLGIADTVQSTKEIQQLFAEAETLDWHPYDELSLDLSKELEFAAEQINYVRPDAVKLYFDEVEIAELKPVFGAEKLHFRHLETRLRNDYLGKLAINQTIDTIPHSLHPLLPDHLPLSQDMNARSHQLDTFYKTPKLITTIDLLKPLAPLHMTGHHDLRVLVRVGHKPLGWLFFAQRQTAVITAKEIKECIHDTFGWQVLPEIWKRSFIKPSIHNTPPITVIVCTRNRTEQLKDCLNALLQQTYANFNILIIDNAPSDSQTKQLIAKQQAESPISITYVCETRPGLNWARNRGIQESSHDLIAFTDDDARPEKYWLSAIVRKFAEPEIMAITGPVLPVELKSPFQTLFEFGYGGMSHGFDRRIIRRPHLTSTQLLWASNFGVGANMAFRKTVFDMVGLFDEALDVGTPSKGGGDIEMFHRIVANHQTLLYEPTATVWHQHRSTEEDFYKHMENNGTGFGVYLITCLRNNTVSWRQVLYFWLRYWVWMWIIKRLIRPDGFPRAFIWREFKGGLKCIPAYFKAQNEKKRIKSQNNGIEQFTTPYPKSITSIKQ